MLPLAGAIDLGRFILVDDNVRPHSVNIVDEVMNSHGINRLMI